MRKLFIVIICCCFQLSGLIAQQTQKDSLNLFKDEGVIDIQLTTDYRKLKSSNKIDDYQPATVTCKFPDSSVIAEPIRLCARGQYRRQNCYVPSIMLDFKSPASPKLSCLGKLKLVSGCATTTYNEQLLIKEYLIYKMYNFITDKSFKVRLLRINYDDVKSHIKHYTQYAFVLENLKDVANRSKCKELKKTKINTENTDRWQMTLVSLFQYMIGNTDWAVPNGHNTRLIRLKKDSLARPYVIPYDFDYAGLVDARYAIPDEGLGTASVTERVYRGFPRSIDELNLALSIFRDKKDSMYAVIKNCDLLEHGNQERMIEYLDEFYKMIDSEKQVRYVFIENARIR